MGHPQVAGGVVAKPGMATGSSGLCVPVLQMMSNGSAEMIFLAVCQREHRETQKSSGVDLSGISRRGHRETQKSFDVG